MRTCHQDTRQPWLLPTVQPRWHNQSMKPSKAMTIRLSAEQAEALETVATVDDMAVVEVIRAAITEHVEARKHNAEFQQGLRERIERAQSLLKP